LLKEWGRIVHIFRENKDFSGVANGAEEMGKNQLRTGQMELTFCN
jgi:hypothetical protein